jgi:DNA-binding response OmpR family regulator
MVVAEQDAVFAGNILDALHTRGIREPAICRSAEALATALSGAPDLVLCDVDLPGLDFCAMAQDVRHGRSSRNPFAVLIATARPSTGTDLARVMRSGIDYIVLKPMTADQVLRRIDGFTRARKPFVVTETFIGPSRRVHRRNDGSDDDLVAVPNTLRIKVRHNNRLSLLGKVLEVGHQRMGDKKSETKVRSVSRLVRRLADLHAQGMLAGGGLSLGEWNRSLAVLVEKTAEVVAEHKGTSATVHVGEIAARILQLTRRWTELSGRPPAVEVILAGRLADALLGALAEDVDIPDIAREIAAVVDSFLGKEEAEVVDGSRP